MLLAAFAAAVLLAPPPGALAVKAAEIESGVVRRAPFQDYLPVRAQVTPLRTVFAVAISGGEVRQVLAADGDRVAEGAPLATLANPQLELDVTSREAEIAGRLGDVSAQQLSLERNRIDEDKQMAETGYNLLKARHDYDIRRRLNALGFVSDVELKTYADAAAYYQAQLQTLKNGRPEEDAIAEAQRAEIGRTGERLKNNLAAVRQSLEALTIRAPAAGRLTNFTLQSGQPLKAGDQVGQVDSEGAYKLTADIDEFYLGRVAVGQGASADLEGGAVPLTVSKVLPQVTDGRFRAELTFRGAPPAGLRRGQTVDVKITLGDTRPALVLANGPWLEASGGAFAFVMNADGRRADRRAIGVGRRNPDEVEITAGLRPGERVVTSSYAGLEKYAHLILR
ncbi:MAG: efflux RND transporter periplasmic adaptor subunit [Caulobacteraceae bacterium]